MILEPGEMYGTYMVTRAEVVADKKWISEGAQRVFECDLLGYNDHKLSFRIYLSSSLPENLKKYKAIEPYMIKGALIHAEFVYRWYNDGLYLCLATFKKATAFRCDRSSMSGDPVSAEEFFNVDRGCWVTTKVYGEWVQFPGVISLSGEVVIPMNLQTSERPKLLSCLEAKKSGYAFTWVKRTREFKDRIKKLLCFKK